MQSSDSDSDESTATSVRKQPYKCIYCSKRFRSGQALGGHQNVHRLVPRVSKQNRHYLQYLATLKASRPHPGGAAVVNQYYSIPNELIEGHGDYVPPQGSTGNGSDSTTAAHVHDQDPPRLPDLAPKLHDFLGKWNSNVGGPQEEVEKSSERTISSPIVKVSRTGTEDLEEEVTSKQNDQELDLELKLGF